MAREWYQWHAYVSTVKELGMSTCEKTDIKKYSQWNGDNYIFELPGTLSQVEVKVNFTLEQATKAQSGSRGIALLSLSPRR